MSFFYDLNKKLDGIRATPEVTHKQLNERDMSRAAKGYEKYGKEGMEALAKAGREGKALDPVRAKYDKYDNTEVDEGAHSQDAMKLNPDFAKTGKKPGMMDRVAQGVKKAANFVAPGDEELLDRLQKSSGARRPSPAAREPNYMEAAKYRDPKYKDKLYTQEPLDHTFGPDMDAAYYNNYPDDYAGRKRKIGGGEFPSTDPLEKGFGRGGIKNNILDRGPRKGMPSRDQITSLKGSIKSARGTHAEPNLPEAAAPLDFDKVLDAIAALYGDDMWENDAMQDLANDLAQAGPTDRELDFIIAKGKLPTRLKNIRFTNSDDVQFGHLDEKSGDPMTAKQKSFAALAPPVNKITFADKIAGAKKEVDEMLGDVAAEAMKSALGRGKQPVRGMGEATKEIPGGRIHTAEPGGYGRKDDEDEKGKKVVAKTQRGRGRPKNNADSDTGQVMKPDFGAFGVTGKDIKLPKHTGAVTKHKMVGEDDLDPKDQGEYDQEGDMAKDTIKTVVRHAQALEKILGDNDNLPEWVQSKLAKIESMMTAVDDYMQNQADDMDMDNDQEPIAEKAVSKKQQRFMGMVSAAKKGEKPASKEVAKVAKTMKKGDAEDFASTKHKGLPEKATKKNKEEDVEESTTSGSVATSGAAPKAAKGASGFTFGKGIYDSMNREVEDMIAESMSINMSMNNDDHSGPTRSLTVTATDDDATKLALLLKSAGLGGSDHDYHTMDENYGVNEVSQNSPDYPTNTETAQDNFEYSGGLNKPKSTGQTTIPVIANQEERQYTNEGQGPSDTERFDHYYDLKASGMDPDAAEEEAFGTDDWYNDMNEQDALQRMIEMSGIREAKAKPDFLDVDKDKNKTEPFKKAVDDKEDALKEEDEFNESIQRMREIAGIQEAKKAVDEEKTEEGNKFAHNVLKAKEAGKKEADLDGDGDMEKVRESIFTLTNQWKAYKG